MKYEKIPQYISFGLIASTIWLFTFCTKEPQHDPDYGLQWAIRMAESVIVRNTNPNSMWNDGTGLVLRGFEELYLVTGERRYLKYIQDVIDATLNVSPPDSSIPKDLVKTPGHGRVLLFLYKETANQEYKKDADILFKQWQQRIALESGLGWQKTRPYSIELNSLGSCATFCVEYAELFDRPDAYDDIVSGLALSNRNLSDDSAGDNKYAQFEFDMETLLNMEAQMLAFYTMALVDMLEHLPASHPSYESVVTTYQEMAKSIRNTQDKKSGLWWHRLEENDRGENYLKVSSSCLFTYALAKGVRKNYLETLYQRVAERAYDAILQHFVLEHPDGTLDFGKSDAADERRGKDSALSTPNNVQSDFDEMGAFINASIEIHKLNQ